MPLALVWYISGSTMLNESVLQYAKLNAMETLFVLTHVIMLACLIGIVIVSITGLFDHDQIEKPSVVASQLMKAKPMQINTAYISHTATALLALFLR